jgi:hypothetical protein
MFTVNECDTYRLFDSDGRAYTACVSMEGGEVLRRRVNGEPWLTRGDAVRVTRDDGSFTVMNEEQFKASNPSLCVIINVRPGDPFFGF